MEEVGRNAKEEEEGEEEGGDEFVFNSSGRKPRPSVLSILPPRLSLRKDTLGDLSSWSASLFSSIPSSSHDGSPSTAGTSSAPTRTPPADNTKRPSKPSVTLPSIVLHSEVREQDGDNGELEDEGQHEPEFPFTASPLYHELMGMMQDRSAVANGIGSSSSGGSPSSANFQLDSIRPVSPDAQSTTRRNDRDSQLTIRLDPRRDSSRDSSASASTIVHATIVRGASIVRRVRADVIPAPASAATTPRSERAQVQAVQEDEEESDSSGSDDDHDEEEEDFSGSPAGTLALTSGPSSQEGEDGGSKSPRLPHLRDPSPSPLRASFPEIEIGEQEQEPEASTETPPNRPLPPPPPPSVPLVPARRPAIAITTTNLESQGPIASQGLIVSQSPIASSSALPAAAAAAAASVEHGGDASPNEEASTEVSQNPRYPAWLAALVLPLAEFIDDAADPRAIFTDLQEIAQGESGSVYAAHAMPAVAQQFQPMTPRSPARRLSQESCEAAAQVAIKRVQIPRESSSLPKLAELRRELELTRALRHANVLHMERLYVDVVEESLWIGMELMDRSLADVLSVAGEEAVDGSGPVAVSEKMVARFVWDVSFVCWIPIASLRAYVRTDGVFIGPAGAVVHP